VVGGEAANPELVRGLAVADRQFLVRLLAAELGRDREWLTADCPACGEAFDFQVTQSALPVKEAGPSFPQAAAATSWGEVRLRVPDGSDQEAVAGIAEPEAAVVALLRRCLLEPAADLPADGWSEADLAACDAALEATSPEVSLEVLASCPACGAESRVAVDPYLCLSHAAGEIFEQVHALASAYHWSQAEILALPRSRRVLYLRLIDRARGMVQ
jgi:hypothetical protein